MKISFVADKVKISGPKVDGTMTVSLDVGEYERKALREILSVPSDVPIAVTLEVDTDAGSIYEETTE